MTPSMTFPSVAQLVYSAQGPAGLALLLLGGAVAGAAFGSFINACAMRLVRGEDFIFTPSRCRGCERPLGWFENLPVLGFLRGRGWCGCGRARLPVRYLAAELLFAFLAINYLLILPPAAAAGFAIAALFFGIALLTDFEAMVLHPPLLLAAGLLGLAFAAAGGVNLLVWPTDFDDALLGIVIGAAVPTVVNAAYRLWRGRAGFGSGDSWMLAAIGAWIGAFGVLGVFIAASVLGAVIGGGLILRGKASTTSQLPFGVFLFVGFVAFPNALMFLI